MSVLYIRYPSNLAAGVIDAIGTIDTGTPSADGAQDVGNALIMQSASVTVPGLVNNTTQSFSGNKTFTGTIAASNLSGTNTGNVTLAAVGAVPNANGAVLAGQVLTLEPANTSNPGVLTAADWNTFNGKQAAGNYITALTGDVTASGPGSVASTVAKIQGTTVSGVTGSTNVVFSSAPTLTNPIVGTQSQGDASTKAASTAYVDTAITNAIAGVNPAVAVQAATTAAANTSTFTYSNGVSGIGATLTSGSTNTALTVDGYTFTALGQRLLVKNDTQAPSGAFNGVYYVTQVQALGLPIILTRALDYDMPSDINNTGAIPVINGTLNGTTQWVLTSLVTTVGTNPLTFTEFARNPADYLLKANNLSDVAASSTSFNNISPVTSTGDLIIGNGANSNTRLAKGTQYQTLQATATTAAYDAVHLDQAAATTGILPKGSGGTGQSSYTDGQLLIGNTSGNTLSKATLTQGTGITITNGNGTITIATSGAAPALGVISKSSNYTAAWSDGVILCNGTFAVTLPASSGNTGALLYIKNIGTGIITLTPFAGNTIDGETSQALGVQYTGVSLIPDGGTAVYVF